jgi:tryptophan synthase alpha chain
MPLYRSGIQEGREMNRYQRKFEDLRKTNSKAFVPFTILGWPDEQASLAIVRSMIESGATALELGFAFSDPVADGPIIQKAAAECLASGFKVKDGFRLLKQIRILDEAIPIGILVYYNLVLKMGVDAFFKALKESGVDGVLIADLPVENVEEVYPSAQKYGVELIFLVSPVTTRARLEKITAKAGGFIYLLSRLGVTGLKARDAASDRELTALVASVKEHTSLPVLAGFGIANAENASAMFNAGADGVIIGSRVIDIVQSSSRLNMEGELKSLFVKLAEACHSYISASKTNAV